jgi:hypothetical protein
MADLARGVRAGKRVAPIMPSKRAAMRFAGRLLSGFAAAALFAGSATRADTVSDILENAGLIGVFAMDCKSPASEENDFYVFRVLDERVQLDIMTGRTHRYFVSVVDAAEEQSSGEISFSAVGIMDSGDKFRWHLVLEVEDGRFRHLEMETEEIGPDDPQKETLVTGGRHAVGDEDETSWYNRCKQ